MDSGPGLAAVRSRVTLLSEAWAMLAMVAVTAVLISTSPTTGTGGAAAAALAALTLVVAGAAFLRTRSMVPAVRASDVRQSRDEAPLVLSGRPTDPVHHPLRPRAPGLA